VCLACAALGALPAAPRVDPLPTEPSAFAWADGRTGPGRLRWTGVAGFRFDLEQTAIAFDPFVTRPSLPGVLFRRPQPDIDLVRSRFADLAAVFVGHTHYDHAMDVPAVTVASPNVVVHGGRATIELCRRHGLPEDRLIRVHNGERYTVGPFTVEAVASDHGKVPVVRFFDRLELRSHGLPRTPFRYPRGEVFAWRIEAAERSFHLQGSAGIDEMALLRQRPVDALIACLAARRGTRRYLERLGERLRPEVLVPCHHDDFFRPLTDPARPLPGLDWRAFLRDAGVLEAAHGTRLWCPPRDQDVAW
jgi:L-ascorbate metabolism protein UlaG (beta-lactamase superfamily)